MSSPPSPSGLNEDTYLRVLKPLNVSKTAQRIQIDFTLDAEASLFADHFASFAVVPGVLQVHWVFQYASDWIPADKGYEIAGLKFRAPMRPKGEFSLIIEREANASIRFIYQAAQVVFSQGRIRFDV